MTADGDLTGNDYVSLPIISADGSLDGINVLLAASAGLIEWQGGALPLLAPEIWFDGVRVDMARARWRRLDRWIPTFTVELEDGSTIAGTVCAPGGYPAARGFLLRIEVDNRGRTPRELRVALEVCWTWSQLRVSSPRPFGGRNVIAGSADGVVLATDDGRGPALAVTAAGAPEVQGGRAEGTLTPIAPRTEISAENGSPVRARISQSVSVRASSRAGVVFNMGVGRERDGALQAARAMRRFGPDHWLRQARLELSHALRPAQDHRWAEILNRNLLFNRYYAVGRAIDDDRIYLLRSRSPLCPDPAIFNEREALLWTLPALVIADPGLAREALFRACEIASDRSGEHSRYLDGGSYDPAFVLDQLLLYSWAIDHYAEATGDSTVLDDPLARQIMIETDSAAFVRLHPEIVLGATELLPSGDVADYPYATLANVLMWRFCDRLQVRPPVDAEDPPPRLHGAATDVAAAIWQHCVTEIDGHPVFACSSSLDGESAVYDDPSLSLALLPLFGFCTGDDPVWRATLDFLRSPRYPLWKQGKVAGLAARSGSGHPSMAALCSDLLTYRSGDALARLLNLRLPAGVASAEYDATSGAGMAPHHASLAGLVAWTLVRAAEPGTGSDARRKRRR